MMNECYSFLRNSYYYVKPIVPRRLQLGIRRWVILRERPKHSKVWPIDEGAGKPPAGWSGWPERKQFALVLTHDVETAKGQERCTRLADLENDLGFRSSFNFVAEGYRVSSALRKDLIDVGFEVGIHGITHRGNPFRSKKVFQEQAVKINDYLRDWECVGFRCPSMYHNLDWIGKLNVDYDASTFDTDPFEPQPEGVGTIFPFWISGDSSRKGYVELPYTLPQDHTLFILMGEKGTDIWRRKLNWIAKCGGMALLNVHPDYMNFDERKNNLGEFSAEYYVDFLRFIKDKYEGQYWHVLPKEMARFWVENVQGNKGNG